MNTNCSLVSDHDIEHIDNLFWLRFQFIYIYGHSNELFEHGLLEIWLSHTKNKNGCFYNGKVYFETFMSVKF